MVPCLAWWLTRLTRKAHAMSSTTATEIVSDLIGQWRATRAELRRLDEYAHPPIVDKFNRVWTWKDNDVYTHDNMAWPASFFDNPDNYGLPRASALNNPNYNFCDICKGYEGMFFYSGPSLYDGAPTDTPVNVVKVYPGGTVKISFGAFGGLVDARDLRPCNA